MDKSDATQLIVSTSKIKSTLIIVLLCGLLNIGTDVSIGLVPGIGDITNSFIDTILVILQVGSIAYLKSNGTKYHLNK